LVRSGTLQLSRRHTTLLEQLRLFPKAAHDDGPDALEMAVAMSREIKRGLLPGDIMVGQRPVFYTEPLGRRGLWL
jgi:hypothetical protein